MSAPIVRRRHLPTEVDTIQWTGDNEAEILAFTGSGNFRTIPAAERVSTPEITAAVFDKLHQSWIGVYTGQHIVRGVKGEHYPIDEDALAETYGDPAAAPRRPHGRRVRGRPLLPDRPGQAGRLRPAAHRPRGGRAHRVG